MRHAARQPAHRFHLLRVHQLFFQPFPLADVADERDGEFAVSGADVAEAHFNGEFRSILAPPGQFQADAHVTNAGVGKVVRAIVSMLAAARFGQKRLDGRTEHLRAGVAEHLLGPGVCQYDPAGPINADDGLGSGFEQRRNHLFALFQETRNVLPDRYASPAGLAGFASTHDSIPSFRPHCDRFGRECKSGWKLEFPAAPW